MKGALYMQIAVNFKDELIAQKVLQILGHFKKDGVEIIKIDDTDNEIINNFKEGLHEIKLINEGELNSRPIQEFLNEL